MAKIKTDLKQVEVNALVEEARELTDKIDATAQRLTIRQNEPLTGHGELAVALNHLAVAAIGASNICVTVLRISNGH